MAISRASKVSQREFLHAEFGQAQSLVLANYKGLSVLEVNTLRGQCRDRGVRYRVVKNSLLRRAAEGSGVAELAEHFVGPTALAFSYGDPVSLAKSLVDYAKDHEAFELRAGLLDGRAIDSGEIATLAKLPSLDQLRGNLVGLLVAPAQKIAAVLAAPGAQLARLSEARRASLEESGDAS